MQKYNKNSEDINNYGNELENLIKEFLSSNIKAFIDVARTIAYWKEYIINSFITIEQTSSDGTIIKRKLSIQQEDLIDINKWKKNCSYQSSTTVI